MDWEANLAAIIKCTDDNLRQQFSTHTPRTAFPPPPPSYRLPTDFGRPPSPPPVKAPESSPATAENNNQKLPDMQYTHPSYQLPHMMEQIRFSIKLEVDARAAIAERQLSAIMALTKSNSDEIDRMRMEYGSVDRELRTIDQSHQKLRQDITTQKDIMYHVQSLCGKDESWRMQADNQVLELRQHVAALRELTNSLQVTLQEKLSRPELLVHFNACVEPIKAQLNASLQHHGQMIGEVNRTATSTSYSIDKITKKIKDMENQIKAFKLDVENQISTLEKTQTLQVPPPLPVEKPVIIETPTLPTSLPQQWAAEIEAIAELQAAKMSKSLFDTSLQDSAIREANLLTKAQTLVQEQCRHLQSTWSHDSEVNARKIQESINAMEQSLKSKLEQLERETREQKLGMDQRLNQIQTQFENHLYTTITLKQTEWNQLIDGERNERKRADENTSTELLAMKSSILSQVEALQRTLQLNQAENIESISKLKQLLNATQDTLQSTITTKCADCISQLNASQTILKQTHEAANHTYTEKMTTLESKLNKLESKVKEMKELPFKLKNLDDDITKLKQERTSVAVQSPQQTGSPPFPYWPPYSFMYGMPMDRNPQAIHPGYASNMPPHQFQPASPMQQQIQLSTPQHHLLQSVLTSTSEQPNPTLPATSSSDQRLVATTQPPKETKVQVHDVSDSNKETNKPTPISSIATGDLVAKSTDQSSNKLVENKTIFNQVPPANELSSNTPMQNKPKAIGFNNAQSAIGEQHQLPPTVPVKNSNEPAALDIKPQIAVSNLQAEKATLINQPRPSTELTSPQIQAAPISTPSEPLKRVELEAQAAPTKPQIDPTPSAKTSTPLPTQILTSEKCAPQFQPPARTSSEKSSPHQSPPTISAIPAISKPPPRLAGPQVTPEVAVPLNVLDDPTMKGALAEAELAKARVEQRLKIERERRHSLGSLPSSSSPVQPLASQAHISTKEVPSSPPVAVTTMVKCTQCNMELSDMSLATHEQSHCRMRFEVCKYCSTKHRAKDLATHESECSKTVIKCKYCSADIALADMAEHELQCDQILKQCPHCLRRQKMSELAEHINSCDCRLVQCPNQCGGKFLQRGLEKHVLTKCPKRAVTAPPPATPPPTAPPAPPPVAKPEATEKQECKYCDESYALSAIEAHEQECDWKPKRCQHCNMVIISRDLARHETSCKQSSRQCTHCQQTFPSASFSAHIPKCTKRPIKCIRCGELFPADIIVVHSTSCKPTFSSGDAKPVVPPPPSTPPPSQTNIASPSKRKSESNLKQLMQPDPKSSLQRHASSIQLQSSKPSDDVNDKQSRRSFALAQLTAGAQPSHERDHEDEESEEEDDDDDDVSLAQVVSEWNVDNVCLWLKEDVGVPDVVDRFDAFQINGRALLELTEAGLISKLGIKVKSHRDRILAAIEAIKTSDEFSSEEEGSQDDDDVEQDEDDDENGNDSATHPITASRENSLTRRMSLQSMPDNSAQTQSNLLNRINSALQTGTAFRTKQK